MNDSYVGTLIVNSHAAVCTTMHESLGVYYEDAHKPQEHAVWRTAVKAVRMTAWDFRAKEHETPGDFRRQNIYFDSKE